MIRVGYFGFEDSAFLFDGEYDNPKQAEKVIAEMYRMGYFNDDDGKLTILVDGIEKDFELHGKIIL